MFENTYRWTFVVETTRVDKALSFKSKLGVGRQILMEAVKLLIWNSCRDLVIASLLSKVVTKTELYTHVQMTRHMKRLIIFQSVFL